jgi:predicted nucleic acid-binding protein
MIVVVESNFILELALEQEEAAEAEFMVALAACKLIRLVIPGCALFEPFETLVRRRKARRQLVEKLRSEVKQLARSGAFPHITARSEPLARSLEESVEVEASLLDAAIRRLVGIATVIPLSDQIVSASLEVRSRFPLTPQDAVVFASVDQFLREQGEGTKVFANRNSADFADGPVEEYFQERDCRLFWTFADALQFVEERGAGMH